MSPSQIKLLSNLHDTLFLCYESAELKRLLTKVEIEINHSDEPLELMEKLVSYVCDNLNETVRGYFVNFADESVDTNQCFSHRLSDAVMNLDMVLNDENPASIVAFYRSNKVDPSALLKGQAVGLSNGSSLKISQGRVVIDDELVGDFNEVESLQKAAIDWATAKQRPQILENTVDSSL